MSALGSEGLSNVASPGDAAGPSLPATVSQTTLGVWGRSSQKVGHAFILAESNFSAKTSISAFQPLAPTTWLTLLWEPDSGSSPSGWWLPNFFPGLFGAKSGSGAIKINTGRRCHMACHALLCPAGSWCSVWLRTTWSSSHGAHCT